MWQGLPSGGSCWHSNATNLKVKMIIMMVMANMYLTRPRKRLRKVARVRKTTKTVILRVVMIITIYKEKENSQTLHLLYKHRHPGSVLVSISMVGCKPLSKEQSPSQMFQMLWYRVDDDGLELMAIFQTP